MRTLHRWQHQYLGATGISQDISQLELDSFFTFSAEEIREIQSRYNRYPAYQFDDQSKPRPVIAQVLRIFSPKKTDPWKIAAWFHERMAGRTCA